jgi:nucleoredoxin
VKYYETRKQQGKDDFEIIFVSGDRSDSEFQSYFAEMPWLALPLGDSRIAKLNERFEVEGIPSLVILDPAGNVVNKSARSGIEGDPKGEKFPYYPEPAEDLSEGVESYGTDLNSTATIIALMENADDDEQSDAKAVLTSFGEIHAKAKAATPDGPEFIFFYAFKPSGISDQIRRLCQLSAVAQATSPQLILLNIPDNGGFYVSDASEVTAESVGALIEGFKNKTLQRKQLSRG